MKGVNWSYTTEPERELGGRRLYWPRGKVLGGSSSINAMCYVRGQPQDYDGWADSGATGWSFREVLPYFKRSEDQQRGADEYHGVGGPLSVEDLRDPNPLSLAFVDAAVSLGMPRNDDFNGPTQEGAGLYQVTQRRGRRCSAAVGYLRPAASRRNLAIETRAHVERILIAGGVNSPQLLMLSIAKSLRDQNRYSVNEPDGGAHQPWLTFNLRRRGSANVRLHLLPSPQREQSPPSCAALTGRSAVAPLKISRQDR